MKPGPASSPHAHSTNHNHHVIYPTHRSLHSDHEVIVISSDEEDTARPPRRPKSRRPAPKPRAGSASSESIEFVPTSEAVEIEALRRQIRKVEQVSLSSPPLSSASPGVLSERSADCVRPGIGAGPLSARKGNGAQAGGREREEGLGDGEEEPGAG